MDDLFDIYPQKFYLLSVRNRRLFSYSSPDHSLEQAVEEAFSHITRMEGGNIHAVYRYDTSCLSVMTELADKYKREYPHIQQLPAYFKQCKDGEYIIRQNAEMPLFDLKSSIVQITALAHGLDAHKAHEAFSVNWAKLYLSFDTVSYGFLPGRIAIGEKDRTKRTCRFCFNSEASNFVHVSHAVQEGLGNHLLIANEECDNCNNLFSNGVEIQLFRFLETNRTLSQVRGKGKSTYHQVGLNFHIHPDALTGLPTVYVQKEHVYNVLYKGTVTDKIMLYNQGPITYQGICKALVKIAVDMIPDDKIKHFKKTGQWVHGDFTAEELPPFCYGEHTFFFGQPVLDLFFRNEKSPAYAPYCTAVLYIYESVFIYIVPYNDVDGDRYKTLSEVRPQLELFKKHEYLSVAEWVEYDSNDICEYVAQFKIKAIGVEGKYNVEYRSSCDPIFSIHR